MSENFSGVLEKKIAQKKAAELCQKLNKLFKEFANELNQLDEEFNFVNPEKPEDALQFIQKILRYNKFDGYFYGPYGNDIQVSLPTSCLLAMVEKSIEDILNKEGN
ncbi:hypothetical protein [Fictibacillus fluitans]|uniref:Phage protein n=1 Tax=Fictibacillus fluitans TaxID=3058422 RepID=A0ABT8HX49_9BACL|nr:hypothetical protein [Fictibacillus sp. NE201]MDN4525358.1 hypothetical protein [Fictibacillus sp. NE201]